MPKTRVEPKSDQRRDGLPTEEHQETAQCLPEDKQLTPVNYAEGVLVNSESFLSFQDKSERDTFRPREAIPTAGWLLR